MAAFIDNLKYRYKTASMPMKLVYINIAVFLLLRIAGVVCFFAGIDPMSFLRWIELPSSVSGLMSAPWTILTYMVSHYDVMHILFNMLVLYWFGIMFLDYFTPKQFVGLYILGGVGGGVLYLLAYILPTLAGAHTWLIGASASVMAIVIAISMKAPHYKMNLLFLGSISLKWIAIVYVVIDVLSITGENMGGHIAHLGGALTGVMFTMLINRRMDITAPINKVIDFIADTVDSLAQKRAKKANSAQHNGAKNEAPRNASRRPSGVMSEADEATLDIILDKIKKSGYASLTEDEKRRLFKVSKNN